jgi:D-alanyl-D-alanine carboxypeptidase/D-alanyl-D-alanine-endopeptidase (penicillin-binding protein 4)
LLSALKEKHIKIMYGNLIVDDDKWETQGTPGGWTWDDIGNYYGAGARGLNWHENQYDIILKPGKNAKDSVAVIETIPQLVIPFIVNELTTGKAGSGDNSIIYLPENGIVAYLRGTIPAGKETFKIAGSIPNPLVAAKYNLTNYLFKNGIITLPLINSQFSIYDKKEKAPTFSNLIFTHYSPPLDSINYWFLQKSVNLFGEAFVKTIAYEKTGFGATDTGLNIIKDFWSKNGIEESALHIIDGSGLSPANRVTTNALVISAA